MLNFQPVRLEDKDFFHKYLWQQGMYGCDNSFANYFIWQEAYHTEWTCYRDALLVKSEHWGKNYFMVPLGMKPEDYRPVADALLEYNGGTLNFDGVYENHLPVIKAMFPDAVITDDLDNTDYIYLQKELASFAGRKFHGQKNHLNAFYRAHPDASYEPITKSNAAECLDFALNWCDVQSAKDITILDEKLALQKAFQYFNELEFRGGAIRFNGKIQAMSLGEKYLDDIADLHFEKADRNVRGLYVAMCQAFAANAWNDVIYLNREEDMGIEGLRTAKQNLHPVMLWKRYSAVIK